MITNEQQKALDVLIPESDKLRAVSMTAAGLVLLTLLLIGFYKPSLVNRVSLRLQAAVSLIDILLSWTLLEFYKPQPDGICSFIGFSNFLLRHLYCFINLSIAVNLHLVFLREMKPRPKFEFIYWGGSLGLALLLDVPLYALDYFGFDGKKVCLMKEWVNYALVSNLLVTTFSVLTFVYCIIVVILVVIKLSRNIDALETSTTIFEINAGLDDHSKSESREQFKRFLRKLITRVALYPLVCIIAQSGDLASLFYKLATGGPKFEFTLWSTFGNSSAGLLNFIAFLFDPTLHIALEYCFKASRFYSRKQTVDNSIELGSLFDDLNEGLKASGKNVDNMSGEALIQNTSYF